MYVGGTETQLSSAGLKNDPRGGIELLELFGDCQGPVRRTIIDNDEFPVNGAMGFKMSKFRIPISSKEGNPYFSVKVRFSNQVMIGRLRRSL